MQCAMPLKFDDFDSYVVCFRRTHVTMRKSTIPRSLKNTVWNKYVGDKFITKCAVKWCDTQINPFTFETGHNIPESKGGLTTVENLRPICAQCNKSMGNRYSIDEFSAHFEKNIHLRQPIASPHHVDEPNGCFGWWKKHTNMRVVPT
jgi:hypothetical protein